MPRKKKKEGINLKGLTVSELRQLAVNMYYHVKHGNEHEPQAKDALARIREELDTKGKSWVFSFAGEDFRNGWTTPKAIETFNKNNQEKFGYLCDDCDPFVPPLVRKKKQQDEDDEDDVLTEQTDVIKSKKQTDEQRVAARIEEAKDLAKRFD